RRAYLGNGYVRDDVAEFMIAFDRSVGPRAGAVVEELVALGAARIELVKTVHHDDKLGFRAAPAVFRRLRDRWRAGALTALAGMRLRWFAESNPFPVHNDPQKGHWGGLPERAGRIATASVSTRGDGYHVQVRVTAQPDARPLRETVRFHVHDSLPELVIEVPVRKGVAELSLNVRGSFTVGIECDRGATALELDLADTPEVDREFLDD